MSHDNDRVTVRRLGPEDWETKRDLRLTALREDGRWFGGDYADSAARSPQQWRDWPGGPVFAVYVDDEPRGIAAGGVPSGGDGHTEVIAMWVDPSGRGLGLAGRLIDAIADWAREQGCGYLHLEVMPNNESAYRAYARFGFAESDGRPRDAGNVVMRYRL